MEKPNVRVLLIGIAAFLIVGFFATRSMKVQKTAQPAQVLAATPAPTVGVNPAPEAQQLLLPRPGASPVTAFDVEKFRNSLSANPKGMPPEMVAQAMEGVKKRMEEAFKSPAGARRELEWVEFCIAQTQKITNPQVPPETLAQMPPEAKAQIAQMPLQMQAGCVRTAQKLAEKFPTLRREVQNRIISKVSSEVVELARKQTWEVGGGGGKSGNNR